MKKRKSSVNIPAGSRVGSARLTQLSEELGFQRSLPAAVLDFQGRVLEGNKRFHDFFIKSESLHFPRDWVFYTETQGPKGLWESLLLELKKSGSYQSKVQVELKTCLLEARRVDAQSFLCVVRLIRPGDTLKDAKSKEELFRALSHELRTSILSLRGYLNIFEEAPSGDLQKQAKARIYKTLDRLSQVVRRLEDFKILPEEEGF